VINILKTITTTLVVGFFLSGCVAQLDNSNESRETWPAILGDSFGAKYVSNFVGEEAGYAAWSQANVLNTWFSSIYNLDTERELSVIHAADGDFSTLDGLFVCSQSIAPGADATLDAKKSLSITVSSECNGRKADFLMGPAAEQAGRSWIPAALNGCFLENKALVNCPVIDGHIRGFLDEEEGGYKTALVETALGTIAVELAWIDIATKFCPKYGEQENLRAKAISHRDLFLPFGERVRLVFPEPEQMAALFYPIDDIVEGEGKNDVGDYSANHALVSQGAWVPTADAASFAAADESSTIASRTWTSLPSTEFYPAFHAWAERLAGMANFGLENAEDNVLGCVNSEQKDALLVAEKAEKEEKDRRDRDRLLLVKPTQPNNKDNSENDSWTLDCEGDAYYEWPQLCDRGERLVREALAGEGPYGSWGNSSGGSSGGSGAGSGSSCHYVNGYIRNGKSVRGYWRNC
jgi:hypothetical protein